MYRRVAAFASTIPNRKRRVNSRLTDPRRRNVLPPVKAQRNALCLMQVQRRRTSTDDVNCNILTLRNHLCAAEISIGVFLCSLALQCSESAQQHTCADLPYEVADSKETSGPTEGPHLRFPVVDYSPLPGWPGIRWGHPRKGSPAHFCRARRNVVPDPLLARAPRRFVSGHSNFSELTLIRKARVTPPKAYRWMPSQSKIAAGAVGADINSAGRPAQG